MRIVSFNKMNKPEENQGNKITLVK